MIKVHRLNGHEMALSVELIESIEALPDTVIHLATGNKIPVRESLDDVMGKVIAYRTLVYTEKKAPNPIEGYVRK